MSIATGALDAPAQYFTWGWVSVSLPNLITILVMISLFVLALVLPFPKAKQTTENQR